MPEGISNNDSSAEGIGSLTTKTLSPEPTSILSEQGYNVSTEDQAAGKVIESARNVGEADIKLQEIASRINGNTEASPEVKNPAMLALEGIKKFAEWRRNANIRAGEKIQEKLSQNEYPGSFIAATEQVGRSATQAINAEGNLARAQAQAGSANLGGYLNQYNTERLGTYKSAANAELAGAISYTEGLKEKKVAREWRALIAKSEKHNNKAQFYGKLAEGLQSLIGLFGKGGENSITKIQENRRMELSGQQGLQQEQYKQTQANYQDALKGQMNAAYTGR